MVRYHEIDEALDISAIDAIKDIMYNDFDIRSTAKNPVEVAPNGTVFVNGDCIFKRQVDQSGKLPVRFSGIVGDFYCNYKHLTSLEGCPTKVGGCFDCSENLLTSLEHCPKITADSFVCAGNPLISLETLPLDIRDNLYLPWHDKLHSLSLLNREVRGIIFFQDHVGDYVTPISKIFNKYIKMPKTRAVFSECAKELRAAGYEGNAKW